LKGFLADSVHNKVPVKNIYEILSVRWNWFPVLAEFGISKPLFGSSLEKGKMIDLRVN